MFRKSLGALVLLLSLTPACAAPSANTLTFVGERLVVRYESRGAQGGLIEFIPPNETIDGWSRLVGYRAFLDSRQSALEAAEALGRQARQKYPGTKLKIYERGTEAIVEFALAASDGTIEYNVFRYAVGAGGHGLVSLQYARRLSGHALDGIPEQAPRWTAEIARFDMSHVRAAFAQPRG